MYLQHYGSHERAKNVLFYALCVLYALSAAAVISGILYFLIDAEVSENSHVFKLH